MTNPHDTASPPARTAAATRARMKAKEERMAGVLRERGWTCQPPGGELVAVIRSSPGGPINARVTVRADGGHGDPVAAFTAAGYAVPPRADRPSYVRPFVDMLAAQGYDISGVWTAGVDSAGRYASVPVKRVHP